MPPLLRSYSGLYTTLNPIGRYLASPDMDFIPIFCWCILLTWPISPTTLSLRKSDMEWRLRWYIETMKHTKLGRNLSFISIYFLESISNRSLSEFKTLSQMRKSPYPLWSIICLVNSGCDPGRHGNWRRSWDSHYLLLESVQKIVILRILAIFTLTIILVLTLRPHLHMDLWVEIQNG